MQQKEKFKGPSAGKKQRGGGILQKRKQFSTEEKAGKEGIPWVYA